MSKLADFAADPLAFFNSLVIPSASGALPFVDVMYDFQRKWFTTIAPSLLAVAAGEQPPIGRLWLERSKGASKDSDASCVLLWLLAFSRQKLDMQVAAADREQSLELKKSATDILRLNGWLAARIEVQAWSLICRATGSQLDIISSDVASAHGARPSILVVNELVHHRSEDFSATLLDNASKRPQGLVIIATNAGFQSTWQQKWRTIAQESDRWNFNQFAEPAPWITASELYEAERRNSRSRFRRLFWGDWISSSGDALDPDDIQASIDGTLGPLRSKQPGWFYVGGLDLGIRHDHSAIVVLACNRQTQQLRLAYAQSWAPQPATHKVDLCAVETTVLDADRRFTFSTLGYDPYQAGLMAQRLELQKVKVREVAFTGASLNLMASTLLDVFRSRRIALYDHPQLIADLGRLTIEERSYGYRLSATHDKDGHADLATALAIALPLAIDLMGSPPITVGAIATLRGRSPLDAWERRRQQLAREFDRLADSGDGRDETPIAEIMRSVGRY